MRREQYTNNNSSHNVVWEQHRRRSPGGGVVRIPSKNWARVCNVDVYPKFLLVMCIFAYDTVSEWAVFYVPTNDTVIYECYVQSSIEFRVLKLQFQALTD